MTNEKRFKLDLPFEEALKRFAQTDARELPENVKLRKPERKRPRKKREGRDVPDPPSHKNESR